MAILYRAIWSEVGSNLVERARNVFCEWVRGKSDGRLQADAAGVEEVADGAYRFQLEYQESGDDAVTEVVRASLTEKRADGSRWTTTVRSWAGRLCQDDDGDASAWLWVDVDAVSHDSLDDVVIGAPRFVPDLLAQGKQPNRRGIPLIAEALHYEGEDGAERLAAMLTSIYRDVPVIVFSPVPGWFDGRGLPQGRTADEAHRAGMSRAAKMIAGIALVCSLDQPGCLALREILGEAHWVRDGAFRIYLPRLDPALDEAWRHRFTVLARYIKREATAGELISRAISAAAGARRAPDSYEAAARLLDAVRTREPEDLLALLELADEEANQQREKLALLDQRYLNALDEQYQLAVENNELSDQLATARRKLALIEPSLWAEQPEAMQQIEEAKLPARALAPSEAADQAQLYLDDYLALPDDARVDLDDLDSQVEARPWGEASWRAFRALHAYAADIAEGRFQGDFWVWCENSGHSLVWPATSKKLAMVESKTVRNTPKLSAKRVFPVDREVSSDERVFMEAHIKIAEGGGPLAPRIYFLHSRATGRVHIGFFGPHRHVPNTLT